MYDIHHGFREKKGHVKHSLPFCSRTLREIQPHVNKLILYCWTSRRVSTRLTTQLHQYGVVTFFKSFKANPQQNKSALWGAVLVFIPYLWISINHFWISKNHAELRISIIHFRISINRLMDIQYSSDLRISKNELWISKNQFVFMDIHNSFSDIHKSIYGYPIFN